MNKKPQILIVEDDRAIRNLIKTTLQTHDYSHICAEDGAQAMLELSSNKIDILLLDLGLPDIDGVEIIKKVRSWSSLPIIVISARNSDKDKIDALDAGADDYLTKPFSVDELLARVRVSLRRLQHSESGNSANVLFQNGDLEINYSSGCAYIKGSELHLTPIEYKIICFLSLNVGKVLTHNHILKEVWGNAYQSDIPSLRVFMTTLRKKIEIDNNNPKYIQTHVGVGYRMLRVDK